MIIKNKAASFFAIVIILLTGYILYLAISTPVTVVIQAGHEGRTTGNTGTESRLYHEDRWNTYVANEVAKQLRRWHIKVKRVPADVSFIRATIAVSIHFDGAINPCASGASIGYPNDNSYSFAQRWKKLYANYFPYKWQQDNFTKNLRDYYAYKRIRAEKFLVLELGEITCDKQAKWLRPRLKKIARLIAYSIATELGKNVKKPVL